MRRPANKTILDAYVSGIVKAIKEAIDEVVPQSRPSEWSKEGWTEECKMVLAEAKRLKRAHSPYNTDESWAVYCVARNHKARIIKRALRKAHRNQVEQAAQLPKALRKLARWSRTRGDIPQRSHLSYNIQKPNRR